MMNHEEFRFHFREKRGIYLSAVMFAVLFAVFIGKYQTGWSVAVVSTAANKGVLLALAAMAQTLPVLTSGIDLSVGMVFVLANCLASHLVTGTPMQAAFGVLAVLAVGCLCGLLNGVIIVYGRLQPIITTMATGSIFFGLALGLRPVPGGSVQEDLADAVTGVSAGIPNTLLLLAAVVAFIWIPYRRSIVGRGALAVGSSEGAAFMSGVPIDRAKLVAYVLSGFLAALGGLLLTFITYSGEASSIFGGTYTLMSIAAVVIGGTSLAGGTGSAVGSIFGAFLLRTIGDLLYVFDLEPLWQPLFQGVILLVAISLGSLKLLKLSNRLELFK